MSLYVGHIPPHIRPAELERVFRRFGRFTLQMKDGYAFAVFEVAAAAEKALRSLRGKYICGEPLTLNWSNKQPKPVQRPARATKIYEPYQRRNFRKDNSGVQNRGSQDGRVFSLGDARIHVNHRDVSEEIDYSGEGKGVNLNEGLEDAGHLSEPHLVETDRWGVSVKHEMVNETEFDRYEPYHDYEREDTKEDNQMACSYEADKHVDNSKTQPVCYNCGLGGHFKRDCLEGNAKRERFTKFSYRRDANFLRDRNDGKFKMPRTSSRGRRERDMKETRFGNSRRSVRRGFSSERRDESLPKLSAEPQVDKRRERQHETQKKVLRKRRYHSSSLSSDSLTSSSQTHSGTSKSKSHTSSHSSSKSKHSRSRPASSSSRSVSISSYINSKRRRSKSSSSRSLSLSVSLDKKPPSSSKNDILNSSEDFASPKGNLEPPLRLIPKQLLHDDMNFETKDGNGSITCKVDKGINMEYSGDNINETRESSFHLAYKENNSSTNLAEHVYAVSENCSDKKPNEGRNPTKITTQEMIFALKHYGLHAPGENDSGTSVEGYFGAARLWPWEMIYYRRLKKGPISTENYARRLQQNKEYGIVDRYIRSSSGWYEQNEAL